MFPETPPEAKSGKITPVMVNHVLQIKNGQEEPLPQVDVEINVKVNDIDCDNEIVLAIIKKTKEELMKKIEKELLKNPFST